MLRAKRGRARIAYRSPSAFAAAMAPKSAGSSTSGVKKSRLATMASPLSSRYTAASSGPSSPTRSRSSGRCGTCCRMRPRSSGPSLHAQPAPCEYWVRRAASADGEFMATEAMATRGVSQAFLPVPLHDGILETVAAHHAVSDRRFRVARLFEERRRLLGRQHLHLAGARGCRGAGAGPLRRLSLPALLLVAAALPFLFEPALDEFEVPARVLIVRAAAQDFAEGFARRLGGRLDARRDRSGRNDRREPC